MLAWSKQMHVNIQTTIFSQSQVQNNLLIWLSLYIYIFRYSQTRYPVAQNASFMQARIHWCYCICSLTSDKGDRRNKRKMKLILLLKNQMKDTFLNIRIHLTLNCFKCCSQESQCYLQRNNLDRNVAPNHFFFQVINPEIIECNRMCELVTMKTMEA